ncbi:MAG: hypothetical protein JSU73_02195 [candidate division WOR-3 bacterium]|nr:MAG: hypothetical protein JSU73_02195 [candidate division WOR-3 bacterium]
MMRQTAALLALACVAEAAWKALGPFGASLGCVVAAPPDDSVVYVCTWGGDAVLYRSTDFGVSWKRAGSVPERGLCLAIDPGYPERLYLGAAQDIYRSTDAGASWMRDSLGYYVSIYDITVHPDSSSVVYAVGTALGADARMAFLHSTDAGMSWTRTSPPGRSGSLFCVEVDPLNPERVYAGGCYSSSGTVPCLYLTTDMGATFTELSPLIDDTQVMALSIHPEDPNVLCAGGLSGLYRSTDRGSTWTQTVPEGTCFDLAVTPADADLVLAATADKVLLSTDAGGSWDSCGQALCGRYYRGVSAGRTQGSPMYAVNSLGFYRSTDRGETWAVSNRGLDMFGRIAAFGISPTDPEVVYTSFALGFPPIPVYRTTDCGGSWTTHATPMSCGNACGIAVSPYDPDLVFCLEGTVT